MTTPVLQTVRPSHPPLQQALSKNFQPGATRNEVDPDLREHREPSSGPLAGQRESNRRALSGTGRPPGEP
jgi:hypothetical protein